MHPETLAHTRDRYRHRTRRLHGQAKGVADGGEETISTADRRLARELLLVERRGLLPPRGDGTLHDAALPRGERGGDLPEVLLGDARLRAPGGRGRCGGRGRLP